MKWQHGPTLSLLSVLKQTCVLITMKPFVTFVRNLLQVKKWQQNQTLSLFLTFQTALFDVPVDFLKQQQSPALSLLLSGMSVLKQTCTT